MKEKKLFNKNLTRAATVMSKLFEIGYDIGAVSMIVGLVLFLVDRNLFFGSLVQGAPVPGEAWEVQGFSIVVTNPDGSLNNTAAIFFLVAGALSLELMAWVFRNVNLILRTTQGLTKFSQGSTPFQKDNVRMMREIGIFFFAITVVQFVLSSIAVLLIGPELAEVSVDFGGIVIGILMLCLSQVFAQGMEMQNEMDGLV